MDMATTGAQGDGVYETDFCCHYHQHDAERGGSYDQYRPAYRYGYDLGMHTHYGRGTWVQIEPEARTLWEAPILEPGSSSKDLFNMPGQRRLASDNQYIVRMPGRIAAPGKTAGRGIHQVWVLQGGNVSAQIHKRTHRGWPAITTHFLQRRTRKGRRYEKQTA